MDPKFEKPMIRIKPLGESSGDRFLIRVLGEDSIS